MLASCYFSSLARAVDKGCKSISFPSISTGVYRYPFDDACRVAISSIRDFCQRDTSIERILLVAFGEKDARRYDEILEEFDE